jgi:hypothetical protein
MEYASVQTLINDTVDDLGYSVMFGHGRDADFNQLKEKKYPLVWLDPMTVVASNPNTFDNTERWAITMVFLVKALATDDSANQNSLVDFSETIARDFINKLNDNDYIEFATSPDIKPLHRTTFGTDHTSGCILTFSLIVYDTYVC